MHGTGTGIRRHRLFFLGFKHKEGDEAGTSATKRSGWRQLWPCGRGRAGWQRGAGGAQATPSGADPQAAGQAGAAADGDEPESARCDDSWMDDYYGSFANGVPVAQASPHLPPRTQLIGVTAAAGASAGAAAGSSPPPLPRKDTSVALSVAAEAGSEAAEADAAAEGADVAAERARVEALWQQW